MSAKETHNLAEQVINKAADRGVMIATAESCTGGMIGAALTDISGSSVVFDRGFITYSNDAKHEVLGVPIKLIKENGAVSEEVAAAMAGGALQHSRASIAVSVTGVAGPTGGTEEKPVGLVWFGLAGDSFPPRAEKKLFENNGRQCIRAETVKTALRLLERALDC